MPIRNTIIDVEENPMLNILNPKLVKLYGASGGVFSVKPTRLKKLVRSFTYGQETVSHYPAAKQLDKFLTLSQMPFKQPYLLCINSVYTDSIAKLVAGWYFGRAIQAYNEAGYGQQLTQTHPVWHTLVGGYKNPMVEEVKKPAMLIISNIVQESTQFKLEKLRDILEVYDDVPRVIVTSAENPIKFCHDIRLSVNHILNLAMHGD